MRASFYAPQGHNAIVKRVGLFYRDEYGGIELQGEALGEPLALWRLRECRTPYIVEFQGVKIKEYEGIPCVDIWLSKLDRLPYDFSPELATKYSRELFEALYAMRLAGVTHRDLKMDNLMCDPATKELRIIDFGLSELDANLVSGPYHDCYTLNYRPPELILKQGYHDVEKAEVWAAGVCVASMLLNVQLVFGGDGWREVLHNISDSLGGPCPTWECTPYWSLYCISMQYIDKRPPTKLLDRVSDPLARDFLSKCLDLDPQSRWTVSALLHHPFINGRELGHAPKEHACLVPISDPELLRAFDAMRRIPHSRPFPVCLLHMADILQRNCQRRNSAALLTYLIMGSNSRSNWLTIQDYYDAKDADIREEIMTLLRLPSTWPTLAERYSVVYMK